MIMGAVAVIMGCSSQQLVKEQRWHLGLVCVGGHQHFLGELLKLLP